MKNFIVLWKRWLATLTSLVGLFLLSNLASANSISCNSTYTVVSGDTLSRIAQRAYNSSTAYTLIYYANRTNMPSGPAVIRVGQPLRIPCLEDNNRDPAQSIATTQSTTSTLPPETDTADNPNSLQRSADRTTQPKVQLLTAGDYQPFTDPALPNGGLITELVEAIFKTQNIPYELHWINDWASHLSPLLKEKKYDIGFPWFYPGCPSENPRCEFLFSEPVFELLEILLTRKDNPLVFEQDSDMHGKTLCRPSGYFTYDLDTPERQWLSKGLVTLKQPHAVKDCVDFLLTGEVDAVLMNDFTSREVITRLNLQDKVIALPRELSIQGMHLLIHKTHPRATILQHQINSGLAAIKRNGQYDEILDQHLMNHWRTVASIKPQTN